MLCLLWYHPVPFYSRLAIWFTYSVVLQVLDAFFSLELFLDWLALFLNENIPLLLSNFPASCSIFKAFHLHVVHHQKYLLSIQLARINNRGSFSNVFLCFPLFPCLQVILTFVCVLVEESVGIAPVPYMLQLRRATLDGRDPFNRLRREKRQVQCQLGQYLHPKGTHCCMRCHAGTVQ